MKKRILAGLLVCILVSVQIVPVYAEEQESPIIEESVEVTEESEMTQEPENTEIVETIESQEESELTEGIDIQGNPENPEGFKSRDNYGYLSADIEVESSRKLLKASKDDELPSAYSNQEYFPEIRNQNPYGICWAFSMIGMAEISMIKQGYEDQSVDYSEAALGYFQSNR